MDVADRLGMVDGSSVARSQRYEHSMAEHLFATGKGELVDQFEGLRLFGVVLNLSIYEDAVASSIVPYMNKGCEPSLKPHSDEQPPQTQGEAVCMAG